MSKEAPPIKYVCFDRKADTRPQPNEAKGFEALADAVWSGAAYSGVFNPALTGPELKAYVDEYKDVKLFSGATYPASASRNNDSVKDIHFLGLDLDDITDQELAHTREHLKGIQHFIYSTYSHPWSRLAGKNRLRVVIALSAPVEKKKWGSFWAKAVDRFDVKADPSCSDPSRAYFFPTFPQGIEEKDVFFEKVPGVPLDVEVVFKAPVPEWYTHKPGSRTLAPLPKDVSDSFLKALEAAELIRGEYGNKTAIFCPWSDAKTVGGHAIGAETSTVVWTDPTDARYGYVRCLHQTCTAPKKRGRDDIVDWLRDSCPEAFELLHPYDVRVDVLCVEDEAPAMIDTCVKALGRNADLFQRSGDLVRVVCDEVKIPEIIREPGTPSIVKIAQPALRETLARQASFIKMTPTKDPDKDWSQRRVLPPLWVVEMLENRKSWKDIRCLEGITEFPVMRPSGSIVRTPGYDPSTGVLYLQPREEVPEIPDDPTDEQLATALTKIEDVISDFYFATPAHKSGFYAAMLTPLARHAFVGNAPLFLIDSSTRGTGKGKLRDIAGIIATGHTPGSSQFTVDDAEMDKRLMAWAMSGERIVSFDNVNDEVKLGGNALCTALTEPFYAGRVLGSSENWRGPQLATFYATGNNVRLGLDMDRRICHIRIDANCERPEERTGFKYPEVVAHVRANRNELAGAALTILVAYRAHIRKGGKPAQIEPWGSYEAWCDYVVRAIVHAGLPDPSTTRANLRRGGDLDAVHRVVLLEGLAKAIEVGGKGHAKGRGLTAREAVNVIFPTGTYGALAAPDPSLQEAVRSLLDVKGREIPTSRQFGELLAKMRDRVINGRMIVDLGGNRDGVLIWAVVNTANGKHEEENAGSPGS